MPVSIEPMLAVLAEMPCDEREYAFEYKWDGIRALTYWDGKNLKIESRNLFDITRRYPELNDLGKALGKHEAVLDGEIIAVDEFGLPSFPQLQRRMHIEGEALIERLSEQVPITYMIFDVLYADGRSTMNVPYIRRQEILQELTLQGSSWRVSPSVAGEGQGLLDAARRHVLEGIVAKRLDSIYEPGRRSPSWLKIKLVQRQEFVVGGWNLGKGENSNRVGSLLVGYYEPRDGKQVLRYAGSVGTGFNAAWHDKLIPLLHKHARATSAFVDAVDKPKPAFVDPVLVAEIEYRRWPAGALMHQASFKGLRTDKKASQVVKEERACVNTWKGK
jgi:bifunctional non-homologous end joining protein LigD